jgi:glycosyltransferase involved in cell wall biosynthesis
MGQLIWLGIIMEKKRIGFVSTRLSGTDGVSLETFKLAYVLERMGHECFFMAGELDSRPHQSLLVPSCHFKHPGALEVYEGCFGHSTRKPRVSRKCDDLKGVLKQSLRDFVDTYQLDLIIPENALTIPLNIPLGLAITEYLLEFGTPAIAHHHDFYWERSRFARNACADYLTTAFPPQLSTIQHVVINSSQAEQLSLRTGVSATIVPNVMDFGNPPPPSDGYPDDFREQLGIPDDHKVILQPTRVIQRKGIEHAVELTKRLGIPATLLISHSSGDEGTDYAIRIREYSDVMGVNTVSCGDRVSDKRGTTEDGKKVYSLADVFSVADIVTYPSTIEGFGNAFLEAIYYRKPIVVNNYAIYDSDIRPKGFRTIEMDHYMTSATVKLANEVLANDDLAAEMIETNYDLGKRFFSFEVLQQLLETLLMNCFGRGG